MRTFARYGIVLAAWLFATGMGPCAFFKPAAPEPPTNAAIIPDYSSPTATLQTLAEGLVDKSQTNGLSVYLGALADSSAVSIGDGRGFHAFFDPQDLFDHPSWDRSRDWNKDLEPAMYSDVVRKYSSPYQMNWGPYEPAGNEIGSDVDSLLHRKYTLMQVVKTGNSVTLLPVAIGAADLYFVKSVAATNKWVIARWQDYHTVDADSAQITLGKRRLDTQ